MAIKKMCFPWQFFLSAGGAGHDKGPKIPKALNTPNKKKSLRTTDTPNIPILIIVCDLNIEINP